MALTKDGDSDDCDVWLKWQDEEKSEPVHKLAEVPLQPNVQRMGAESSSPRTQMAQLSDDDDDESDAVPCLPSERKRRHDSSDTPLSPTCWVERLLHVFSDIWAGVPKTGLTVATLCSGLGTPTMAMKVHKWKKTLPLNFERSLALPLSL
eukprot:4082170-Amphidinium_carterae.2